MIWHVKKPVTKREREQYEEWLRKHEEAGKKAEERLKQRKPKQSFFQAQSKMVNDRLADYRATPSLPPQPPEEVKVDPLLNLDPEEREEYLRREKAAQEEIEAKKSRTGPMYNKGGDQYWTEEMLNDLKSGGHRRR